MLCRRLRYRACSDCCTVVLIECITGYRDVICLLFNLILACREIIERLGRTCFNCKEIICICKCLLITLQILVITILYREFE